MPLILNETFTDTDGIDLAVHTSESLHTWSIWNGVGCVGRIKTYGGLSVADSAGSGGSNIAHYFSSAVIGTADVSMTFAGMLANLPDASYAPNSVGVYARMTRLFVVSSGQTEDGWAGYNVYFALSDNSWHLYRVNSPSTITRNVFTSLATSTVNPLIKTADTTPRTFTFEVTGTGASVRCLLKDGSTTILDFSDTSADRLVAEGKVGIMMGAYNGGNSGRMDSIQASSVVAVTPVSFSGPVPTRNGVVGTAASFTNAGFFAGSATPFAYTLQAGTLPAGLSLDASTGIISGAPTTAGTNSGIVIRATDANSATADTNAYSIVIAATNASPTFPGSISNISGTAGSAITPVNVSGQFSDTDALAYTASPAGTAWPSALVVNSSTGIISGTVAGAGTTTGMKVRATDTASQTVDSNAFNAVIAAASTTVTFTPTLPLKRASNGALRTAVAVRVSVLSPTTDVPIVTVASITTHATTAVPPPFTVSGPVAGTSYPVKMTNVDDATDYALSNLTPV